MIDSDEVAYLDVSHVQNECTVGGAATYVAAMSAVLFLTFSARAVAMPHRLKRPAGSAGGCCLAVLLLASPFVSSSESVAAVEGPCRLFTMSNMLSGRADTVLGLVPVSPAVWLL